MNLKLTFAIFRMKRYRTSTLKIKITPVNLSLVFPSLHLHWKEQKSPNDQPAVKFSLQIADIFKLSEMNI